MPAARGEDNIHTMRNHVPVAERNLSDCPSSSMSRSRDPLMLHEAAWRTTLIHSIARASVGEKS